MLNKLRKRSEKGASTLIMFVVLMPLFIMVFGYGVDTAIATYTKNTLQDSLDSATQSALSMSVNPPLGTTNGGVSVLTPAQTMKYVNDLYDMNRKGKVPQLLTCYKNAGKPAEAGYNTVTPASSSINRNPSGKCYQITSPKITTGDKNNRTKTLTVTVIEYSRNSFLATFFPNLQYQKYVITSKATITTANG